MGEPLCNRQLAGLFGRNWGEWDEMKADAGKSGAGAGGVEP